MKHNVLMEKKCKIKQKTKNTNSTRGKEQKSTLKKINHTATEN